MNQLKSGSNHLQLDYLLDFVGLSQIEKINFDGCTATCLLKDCIFERCIQNPVKHLKWRALRKQLTVKSRYYFHKTLHLRCFTIFLIIHLCLFCHKHHRRNLNAYPNIYSCESIFLFKRNLTIWFHYKSKGQTKSSSLEKTFWEDKYFDKTSEKSGNYCK